MGSRLITVIMVEEAMGVDLICDDGVGGRLWRREQERRIGREI